MGYWKILHTPHPASSVVVVGCCGCAAKCRLVVDGVSPLLDGLDVVSDLGGVLNDTGSWEVGPGWDDVGSLGDGTDHLGSGDDVSDGETPGVKGGSGVSGHHGGVVDGGGDDGWGHGGDGGGHRGGDGAMVGTSDVAGLGGGNHGGEGSEELKHSHFTVYLTVVYLTYL